MPRTRPAAALAVAAVLLAATSAALGQTKPAHVAPNLYKLTGPEILVTYATSGIDGKPHFQFKDRARELSFSGDQIRVAKCDLGTVVSVTVHATIDAGTETFSLLLPGVNIEAGSTTPVPVATEGILAVHHLGVAAAQTKGQLDTYTTVKLAGTAAHVVF
jgi:hypothetical protein